MTRVVSYSLFRNPGSPYESADVGAWQGRFYARYLPALVRAHHAIYDGWQMRIHHDEHIYSSYYGDVLMRLAEAGLVTLVPCGRARRLGEAALWRWKPIWDEDVEVVLSRDVDAIVTPREKELVLAWLDRGTITCQVLHGHPVHQEIMTGMFGCWAARFRRENDDFSSWEDFIGRAEGLGVDLTRHGSDQALLNDVGIRSSIEFQREEPFSPGETNDAFVGRPDLSLPEQANSLTRHIGACRVFYAEAVEFYDQHAADFPGLGSSGRLAVIQQAEQLLWVPVGSAAREPFHPERRVVLSSTQDRTYGFFMPLTTALWRQAGWKPTMFVVGQPEEWQEGAPRVSLDEARRQGAEIYFLDHVEAVADSTVAQVSRVAVAGLWNTGAGSEVGRVYAMTADMDMWPLAPAWWQVEDKTIVKLWYANAYIHEEVPHYALCYIGMPVSLWRQMTGDGGGNLNHLVAGILAEMPAGSTAWDAWNFDEKWISARIVAHEKAGGQICRLDRDGWPPADRIDRPAWPRGRVVDCLRERKAVDAHLLRPGCSDENWPELATLYRAVSKDEAGWIEGYRERYVRALAGAGAGR